MFHTVVANVEAHAQIIRTKHTVKVGHFGELLGSQSSVEGVQTFYAVIFPFDVSFHEVDVWS